MMLRPKDVIDQLGISAPTLRVWSNTFAEVLSPSAQAARTESGGNAQRRYTRQDLAYFHKAKGCLDSGLTFEQTLAALQALDPAELTTDMTTAYADVDNSPDETAPAILESVHPVIQAFEQTIRAKDETIQSLREQIDELRARPATLPPPPTAQPRFRWTFLNWLFLPPVTNGDNSSHVDADERRQEDTKK